MKLILTIFLTFTFAGCVMMAHQSDDSLYQEYQAYKNLVGSGNKVAARRKLAKNYLKNHDEAERNMPPELGLITPFWKHIANEIRTEHSHFEKIAGDSGCLTLNGLDKYDRPSSLSLYYIEENGNWVINGIMVGGHGSIGDYYNEPTCPSREELLAE